VDDSGFPRTPDRLLKFCGTHVWPSEAFKIMICACKSYYLGGSVTHMHGALNIDKKTNYTDYV
jgi:hypothetical protein